MAITLPRPNAPGEATLPEAVSALVELADPDDPESLYRVAPAIWALANNPTFLSDKLVEEMVKPRRNTNGLLDTSLGLYSSERLVLRANFWLTLEDLPTSIKPYSAQFSYLYPHNHAFDFLTVGYLGPGYSTSIYEMPLEQGGRQPGDAVDLVHLEDTELPQGKMMIYRALRDIHKQWNPPAFSISLNVLLLPASLDSRRPAMFDLDRCTVAADSSIFVHRQSCLYRMALAIADPGLLDALEWVSKRDQATAAGRAALDSQYQGD